MNRREFIVAAGGVSGASAAATAGTPVAAQEDGQNESAEGDDESTDSTENESDDGGGEGGEGGNESESGGGGGGGGGGTETVDVVDNAYEPAELTIEPGTTVEFVWQDTSAQHNVNPTSQPDGAEWEGHTTLEDGDFSFESTFETEGDYEYQCDPHVSQGMTGVITVTTETEEAAGGDVDIHDIGVPLQKHWLGVATMLVMFVSLVFTFYLLKYGESAHSSSPGRR